MATERRRLPKQDLDVTVADIGIAAMDHPDLAATVFLLPPDAKFLRVSELSPRLRAKIGPVEEGQSVITRPGLRVTTRLVPAPLADLIREFRDPSLLTEAVVRFARGHDEDPSAILDMAFDALATLVEARILVPHGSADAKAPTPSLSAGQAFAGLEIDALVRSLDDSEVYRARGRDGLPIALKIARNDRPAIVATLAHEARMLELLRGADSPRLLEHASERGRAYLAIEWCDGVSIAVAAQQARAARDRTRLHGLVNRMLAAYGRLHGKGVLHGDIHPGNCLVRDDGRVVLVDFGNARRIDRAPIAVDPTRTGIPQFHDPLMASEVLAGRLPPAATAASEQYSVAVLAYLLLTGLHPIEAPAVQDELLRRITERRPLPFAARGVAAWPGVEAVINRALAREPSERFADVAALTRAFASAKAPSDARLVWPEAAKHAFDATLTAVRSVAPSSVSPRDCAWFGLRAAVALEDAELLAAASILSGQAGSSWAAQAVAAQVARARSDKRTESAALAGFVVAAEPLSDGPRAAAATLAAATILEGAKSGSQDEEALAGWAARSLDRMVQANQARVGNPPVPEPVVALVALALVRSGAVAIPAALLGILEALYESKTGDVWLWALAHDVVADDRFKALALGSPLPNRPLERTFALLRLHQLTGDMSWVHRASQVAATAPRRRLSAPDRALLMVELMAPERAIPPPYLIASPWGKSTLLGPLAFRPAGSRQHPGS